MNKEQCKSYGMMDTVPYKDCDHDLEPKTEKTRRKYMDIFVRYSVDNRTQLQIAHEMGLNYNHVNRIIKWAALELNKQDPEVGYASTLEYLNRKIQEMESVYESAVKIKDKVLVNTELRHMVALRSKILGLMKTTIETGDKNLIVNFPNFKQASVPQKINRMESYNEH